MNIELDALFNEEVLKWFCYKAAIAFDNPRNGRFTNACFSNVVMQELRLKKPLDGNTVRIILCGRSWLKKIDSCQYQMVLGPIP